MEKSGSTGSRILLVEDEPGTRTALAALLEGEGYEVTQAADGREALAWLHEDAPADLILLDLMMPGMDGWEFRRRQRQEGALAGTPVVVVTAAAGADEVARPLDAAAVLQKPVAAEILLAAIRRLLPVRRTAVLVVDDEVSVRDVLRRFLEHAGFTVWAVAGGQEALELYDRHRNEIGLVLLDVRMTGLDGPRTLAALRRIDPQVRCCFMSGDDS